MTEVKEPCCKRRHFHWHRLRTWEAAVGVPLLILWVGSLTVMETTPRWLIVPLALALYVSALWLLRRGMRRTGQR